MSCLVRVIISVSRDIGTATSVTMACTQKLMYIVENMRKRWYC